MPRHFDTLIKGFRFPEREKLPSVYTEEEISQIGKSINRNEFGAKRLYAIFMLASRLGLRSSDIRNIKFEDIDWDKNCITLIQQKTKRKIELPLIADVSNAIVDYLKNERECRQQADKSTAAWSSGDYRGRIPGYDRRSTRIKGS